MTKKALGNLISHLNSKLKVLEKLSVGKKRGIGQKKKKNPSFLTLHKLIPGDGGGQY